MTKADRKAAKAAEICRECGHRRDAARHQSSLHPEWHLFKSGGPR